MNNSGSYERKDNQCNAPSDDGFYSSGHPAPGAALPNPLGIIKSTDGGQTIANLSAVGERDFHVLGVGYINHALYVFNSSATRQIPAGIAVSRDDGTTWSSVPVQGLSTRPNAIAVHPTDAQIVAFATDDGMWLSADAGATVTRLADPETTTAATFSVADGRLWYGGQSLAVYAVPMQTHTLLTFLIPRRASRLSRLRLIRFNPTISSLAQQPAV